MVRKSSNFECLSIKNIPIHQFTKFEPVVLEMKISSFISEHFFEASELFWKILQIDDNDQLDDLKNHCIHFGYKFQN